MFVFPIRNYYLNCPIEGNENSTKECWSLSIKVIYNTTSRAFFALGVGLILMPTYVGRLRIIKNFLSAEIFIVMGRLNYEVYLIHCIVIYVFIASQEQGFHVTSLSQLFFSIGVFVATFTFAIPCTLFFEVPFMNIDKTILFPQNSKTSQPKTQSLNEGEIKLLDESITESSTKSFK